MNRDNYVRISRVEARERARAARRREIIRFIFDVVAGLAGCCVFIALIIIVNLVAGGVGA